MHRPTPNVTNMLSLTIRKGLSYINVNGYEKITYDELKDEEVFKLKPTTFSYNSKVFAPHIVTTFKDYANKPLEDLLNSWLLNQFRYTITIDPRDLDNPVIVHFIDDGLTNNKGCAFEFIKQVDYESVTKPNTVLISTYMQHLLNFTDYSAFDSLRESKNNAVENNLPFIVFDHLGKFPSKKTIDLFTARLSKRVDKENHNGFLKYSSETRILIQLRCRLMYPELKLGVLLSVPSSNNHAVFYLY